MVGNGSGVVVGGTPLLGRVEADVALSRRGGRPRRRGLAAGNVGALPRDARLVPTAGPVFLRIRSIPARRSLVAVAAPVPALVVGQRGAVLVPERFVGRGIARFRPVGLVFGGIAVVPRVGRFLPVLVPERAVPCPRLVEVVRHHLGRLGMAEAGPSLWTYSDRAAIGGARPASGRRCRRPPIRRDRGGRGPAGSRSTPRRARRGARGPAAGRAPP